MNMRATQEVRHQVRISEIAEALGIEGVVTRFFVDHNVRNARLAALTDAKVNIIVIKSIEDEKEDDNDATN